MFYEQYGQSLTKQQFIAMIEKSTANYGAVLVDSKTPSDKISDIYCVVRADPKLPKFRLKF